MDVVKNSPSDDVAIQHSISTVDGYLRQLHDTLPPHAVLVICGFTEPFEVKSRIQNVKDSSLSATEQATLQLKNEEIVSGMRQGTCWITVKKA